MSSNIDNIKLGGARQKNGHKLNCKCHICENMRNKAKRGGYTDEMIKETERKKGGSKKKNGHRMDCKCPICKNMARSKKNKKGGLGDILDKSRYVEDDILEEKIIIRKSRKGGSNEEPDVENQYGDIEEGKVKASNSMSNNDDNDMTNHDNEVEATMDDYDALDAAEKGEAGTNLVGGTRKRKHKKSARKSRRRRGKKTRRHRK